MKEVIKQRKVSTKSKGTLGNRKWQLYGMMAIPLLFVIVFSYIPMFGIIIGFKDYKYSRGILGSEWVGLKNFEFMVKSNDFWNITRNTILLNLLFIVVGVISAVVVALIFYELKSRIATKVYQTIFITPHFLSWVVVAYMVYALLSPEYGTINKILGAFGISQIKWYSEPKWWPLILTITNTWKIVGMDSVIYYAALMGIDSTLYEAAEVDGAGKLKIVKNIILPCLVPLIAILTILKIGNIFRADFGLFYQVTRDSGALYSVTDVIDTYLYRTLTVTGDMSLSTSVGFLQSIVGMVLVLITNYITRKINPDNALF